MLYFTHDHLINQTQNKNKTNQTFLDYFLLKADLFKATAEKQELLQCVRAYD